MSLRYVPKIMSTQVSENVKSLARDLRTGDPRNAKDPLGGFEGGMRALDKCRATLAGINGEYQFNCPLDQRFFRETGIDVERFKSEVARGASDEEMDAWVRERALK